MRKAAYIFAGFIILFTAAACQREPKKVPRKLNIAFQEWVGYGPLYLANEKGFFKEEGINLVFIDEQLDSARRDAFKAGMLDCEAGTIDLLVSKRAQGVAITAVLELDRSLGADAIVASQDIKKLEDLIGRKVALARDDVGETFLSYLFRDAGFSLDKVDIVPKSPEEVAQAFLNGEADAAVTWEPFLSQALQRPGAHMLISTKDKPGIIIDTLNIRQDLIKDNPRLVKSLIRAWFRAVKYYKDHPLEASEIIARHYNITAAEYREKVKGLLWVDYNEQLDAAYLKNWIEVFKNIAEIKLMNKRLDALPDVQGAINQDLLKTAYENSH
jgi:NitT/TauT family transport system substrate-binding protein